MSERLHLEHLATDTLGAEPIEVRARRASVIASGEFAELPIDARLVVDLRAGQLFAVDVDADVPEGFVPLVPAEEHGGLGVLAGTAVNPIRLLVGQVHPGHPRVRATRLAVHSAPGFYEVLPAIDGWKVGVPRDLRPERSAA